MLLKCIKSPIPTTLLSCAGALVLSGCVSNTKIDDGAYRSIGQQAPRQVQKYAEEELADRTSAIDSGGIPVPDFPGETTRLSADTNRPINTGTHLVRYGHPGIIDKIVKTARIHCQPLAYQINTTENSFWGKEKGTLVQCSYRFPKHCGAHQFSVLSYGRKTVLIYQPPQQTHYIIDTLQGTPKSQPGLWDIDDHIGSSTTNANYLFHNDYNSNHQQQGFNPTSLGWIIKASHKDEEEFGKQYHRAIEEITACF